MCCDVFLISFQFYCDFMCIILLLLLLSLLLLPFLACTVCLWRINVFIILTLLHKIGFVIYMPYYKQRREPLFLAITKD